MRTSGATLSVLTSTLTTNAATQVDEMCEDGKEDQEYESGKLEDIYVSLPRFWLLGRSQGRIEGGVGAVW